MSVFDKMVPSLLSREGGEKFTNNPADKGGPTRWGVTAAKLGEYRKLGRPATADEVKNLGRDEAVALYRADFWQRPGFESVSTLSERIAEELFDTGVNMGVGTPGPWLQRALNAMNHQGRDYPDMVVDGQIGPLTCSALRNLIKLRGQADAEEVVLKVLNGFQVVRYIELAEKRGPNEEFVFGWLKNRVGL